MSSAQTTKTRWPKEFHSPMKKGCATVYCVSQRYFRCRCSYFAFNPKRRFASEDRASTLRPIKSSKKRIFEVMLSIWIILHFSILQSDLYLFWGMMYACVYLLFRYPERGDFSKYAVSKQTFGSSDFSFYSTFFPVVLESGIGGIESSISYKAHTLRARRNVVSFSPPK